ncbi:MAG: hypothetical protein Q8S33_31200 [Myxococcales bacterium]|nr:hypothetical protein [Myxococcales bacterium]
MALAIPNGDLPAQHDEQRVTGVTGAKESRPSVERDLDEHAGELLQVLGRQSAEEPDPSEKADTFAQ